MKEKQLSPGIEVFRKLSKRYLLALGVIALVLVVSNIFIQNHLNKQIGDSRIINVSGRQRMLSQQLSKQVLQLSGAKEKEDRINIASSIKSTLDLWKTSHEELKNGSAAISSPRVNSPEVIAMFEEIEIPFNNIVSHAEQLLAVIDQNPETPFESLEVGLNSILSSETHFLKGMNTLVFQYDQEANAKVVGLRRIEYFILIIGLLVLLVELLFIFQPTAVYVRNTVKGFDDAKQDALGKSQEIKTLYEAKEQSLQELKALNFAVDQAMLFASINRDGSVVYMSNKLLKFLGHTDNQSQGSFAERLTSNEAEQQHIDFSIRSLRSSIWEEELPITTVTGNKKWLDIRFIPVNKKGVKQDYLIIAYDITERKEVQNRIDILNKMKFDQEFEEQKLRSVQVVVAQENERKRIAKDIHDSIGQMLTSLKFNLEGINLDKPDRAKVKLEELKQLTSDVIKGVRMATFNLTPPELVDYGVVPAIKKLVGQGVKLTGKNIIFENRTNFNGRFNEIIETNIYRICQEAVNNAIKYANSNYILVSISHTIDLVSVVVEDDGDGFDLDMISEKNASVNSGMMGLTFMKERTQFIDGRIFIRSAIGKGTRITLNIPMPSDEQILKEFDKKVSNTT